VTIISAMYLILKEKIITQKVKPRLSKKDKINTRKLISTCENWKEFDRGKY